MALGWARHEGAWPAGEVPNSSAGHIVDGRRRSHSELGSVRTGWYFAYGIGVALNAGGVYCSLSAYARTFKVHGKTDLLPWMVASRRAMRGFLARFLPFLRKDTTVHLASGTAHAAGGSFLIADMRLVVPADAPVELQIRALNSAIESLDRTVVAEREARASALADVHSQLGELSQRLVDSVQQLDEKLYDVGIESLRRQILGVSMVILGTVLLGLLGLFPPA